MEDCESRDTECLRTPFVGLAKDGENDGERGGDLYEGGPPSSGDAPIAPISQLLQDDVKPSAK